MSTGGFVDDVPGPARRAKRAAKKVGSARGARVQRAMPAFNGPTAEEVPCEMDELEGYRLGANPDTAHVRMGWDGHGGRQIPYDSGTYISVTRVVDRGAGAKGPPSLSGGVLLGHVIEFEFLSKNRSKFRIEKMRGDAIRLLVDGEEVYAWDKVENLAPVDVLYELDDDDIE